MLLLEREKYIKKGNIIKIKSTDNIQKKNKTTKYTSQHPNESSLAVDDIK